MRVNFIAIDMTEADSFYRYQDPTRLGSSSIKGLEDLEDDYYSWIKEKDFAWCPNFIGEEDQHSYIIAFFENHPFFNCTLLRYSELVTVLDTYDAVLPASKVVEPWLVKLLSNYKRRKKRKEL